MRTISHRTCLIGTARGGRDGASVGLGPRLVSVVATIQQNAHRLGHAGMAAPTIAARGGPDDSVAVASTDALVTTETGTMVPRVIEQYRTGLLAASSEPTK